MNLVVPCGPYRVTRSDIGLNDLKHLRKVIVKRMVHVLARSGPRVFYSRLVSGLGWGSEVLLEQVQLNFSFRNKFIICFRVAF